MHFIISGVALWQQGLQCVLDATVVVTTAVEVMMACGREVTVSHLQKRDSHLIFSI